jgi:hypothetical protein
VVGGPSNPRVPKAKSGDVCAIMQEGLSCLHFTSIRDGILSAANHPACPPAFGQALRALAADKCRAVPSEYAEQDAVENFKYLSLLTECVKEMGPAEGKFSGAPDPASLHLVAQAHVDSVARVHNSADPLVRLDAGVLASHMLMRVSVGVSLKGSSNPNKRPYTGQPGAVPDPQAPLGVCRDWVRGRCYRPNCIFSHPPAAILPAPPGRA